MSLGVPTVPTILNTSNCFIYSNSASGNALSVQQLGAGNVVAFSNASGGSNVLVMNNLGQVGIGSVNPTYNLDVYGSGDASFGVISTRFKTSGANGCGITLDATNVTGGKACTIWSSGGSAGEGQGKLLLGHQLGTAAPPLVVDMTNARVGVGLTNPSQAFVVQGTANVAPGGTTALFVNSSGQVGIGTASPQATVNGISLNGILSVGAAQVQSGSDFYGNYLILSRNGSNLYSTMMGAKYLATAANTGLDFHVTDNSDVSTSAPKMTIRSSGNVGIGTNNPSAQFQVQTNTNTSGTINQTYFSNFAGTSLVVIQDPGNANLNAGYGGGNACIFVSKATSTGRSINAAGTVNVNGADYAEYMTKSGDFTIQKGDICGVNAQGLLTNVFADSITFMVKTTNPSYVGGDVWGTEEALGLKKPEQVPESDPGYADYQTALEQYNAKLEEARARVDRIAFAGQVPVNVLGATPGQYIVPVANEDGSIGGQAVSSPTFEQYTSAVGKVIKVLPDGRAQIIVKVV